MILSVNIHLKQKVKIISLCINKQHNLFFSLIIKCLHDKDNNGEINLALTWTSKSKKIINVLHQILFKKLINGIIFGGYKGYSFFL